jgi:hypothetical protein
MAIDKVHYISKFDPSRVGKALKHLRYIVHRKGREGEKMERQLFTNKGAVPKEYAQSLIENSRGMNIFKIILNFDPKREDIFKDLDLRSITHHVMLKLKELLQQDFEWVAVMHNDHGRLRFDGTPKRHIHSMVFVNGRLEKEHLTMLREVAHEQAMKQRLQLDLMRERHQHQEQHFSLQRDAHITRLAAYQPMTVHAGGRARHVLGTRFLKERIGCQNCSYRNSMVKLKDGKFWCPTCGKVRARERELSL